MSSYFSSPFKRSVSSARVSTYNSLSFITCILKRSFARAICTPSNILALLQMRLRTARTVVTSTRTNVISVTIAPHQLATTIDVSEKTFATPQFRPQPSILIMEPLHGVNGRVCECFSSCIASITLVGTKR